MAESSMLKSLISGWTLDNVEPPTADIITRAVESHNRAALPEGEPKRCRFFLRLLRDAHKVDIWRVVSEYYRDSENNRNRTIELDLPDIGDLFLQSITLGSNALRGYTLSSFCCTFSMIHRDAGWQELILHRLLCLME